ncbi:MAG: hypothetical protein LUF86_05850 [Clostridiales bacterium]|nr:hypothetical protein [Clostridiales bacterium]
MLVHKQQLPAFHDQRFPFHPMSNGTGQDVEKFHIVVLVGRKIDKTSVFSGGDQSVVIQQLFVFDDALLWLVGIN